MAKRRRIPWWVTMVAFAIFSGGAIGGLAYLRARRAKDPTMFCLARTPSGDVLRKAKVKLVERGSVRHPDYCEINYVPPALRIVSRRAHWNTVLMEVGATARTHAVSFDGGAYFTFDNEIVMVMPGIEGEAIEIHVAHDTFDDVFAVPADIRRRLR